LTSINIEVEKDKHYQQSDPTRRNGDWSGLKSPTRARSRSLQKTVHDLENADPPTIYLQIRHPDTEVPTSVRNLNNNNVMQAGRRERDCCQIQSEYVFSAHGTNMADLSSLY
jgi:hypothetical protein